MPSSNSNDASASGNSVSPGWTSPDYSSAAVSSVSYSTDSGYRSDSNPDIRCIADNYRIPASGPINVAEHVATFESANTARGGTPDCPPPFAAERGYDSGYDAASESGTKGST
ncbi:hypothetical protein HD806DRAFT_299575 [Xylariaceae sp. AK1471]|nr:hypothetical protein HD806DRAFT_299575 [Xylariaceae sp. AK1471]